jgi:integrase
MPIERKTAEWLGELDTDMRQRLAKVGLVPEMERVDESLATVAGYVAHFIAQRTDFKERTVKNFRQTETLLVMRFGADRLLASITPGDADEFRYWMAAPKKNGGRGLSENTLRRHCGRAKQIFNAARKKNLIKSSPFADMKDCNVRANRGRDYFLSREDATRVLDACPNTQWRLLVALSRYGGLRCPSEPLGLRWSDIDWERGRMTVRSPKTEHHEGKGEREVPLFPELRPYLEAARAEAMAGDTHVITIRRDEKTNLRTGLQKIICRAGLKPWPKLWQNLRATRATELATEYPGHVAAVWLGHSESVAQKHYWQVTDEFFERAVDSCTTSALQSALQPATMADKVRQTVRSSTKNPQESRDSQGIVPNEVPPRGRHS